MASLFNAYDENCLFRKYHATHRWVRNHTDKVLCVRHHHPL